MENEALIVSETNRHEDKNTVDIVFSDEERVEASAGLGTDGRDELEEEVFEEAVEEYLQEQGVKSDITDDTVVGEERKMEVNGDWGLAGVDDIPSVRDEVEKFDEAIGVSGKVGEAKLEEIAPAAEVVGALTEMNSDNGVAVVREIDEGSTDAQLAPDEVNELNNGGLIGGGEDKGNDILHIQEDGETEAPNGVVGGGEDGGKDILDIQVDGETEAPNSVVGDGEDGEKEISEKNATGEIKAENAKEGGGEACEKEGVTVVQLAPDEMNRLNNGDSIGGGEVKGNDILDIQEDGETEAPNGIVGVGENGGKEISGKNAIGEIEADNVKEGGGKAGEKEISEIGYGGRVEATYCSVGVEDGEEGTAEVGAGGKIEATNGVCDIDVKEEKPYAQVAKEEEKQYAQVAKEQVEKQSAQVNRQQETKPAQPPHASSGKSPNLAPPPARPAGLGRGASLLEPVPRVVQQPRLNGSAPQVQNQQIEEPVNGDAEESDETREKLQMIRVKFLRLAHRLGQTPHNVVVAQVLYRLGLAEQLRGRNGGRVGAFSFDRASAMAEQLEASGNEPLDFSCTIMVLGKTGVGKSATINSIFDEMKFNTDAFQTGTKKVQDVVGTVQGIKVRVIDTPGLLSSWADQRQNEKILHSVKHFIKKTSPDIVLYLDRLDVQNRDFSDMPLLRTITDIFGPSIWFNAIVVLTHAASAPPEGPNGTASSYDMFVTQRSHVVQQAIRQAAGDMRLMNPVSLVENHSACRTNRAGQRVLPNGQVWKPHLLLLSFASKILAEANALLKLQDTPPGKPYTTRSRAPPLPFLLSSLLQSRPQLKLPEEQLGDDDSLDGDLDESSDSDDDSEFDELPPFRRLTKAQVEKLSKAQRKAYFDELEYREKLFMKKQLKEEKKRRKLMKKMSDSVNDQPSDYNESTEEEGAGAASVPVPMPDLALPASFDSDNPTHRFRYLDSSNQWLVRPVLETHGWDHDIGYEGINVERLFAVKNKMPLSFSGQITKDKKDANVQMEVASSIKHGENKATSLGFDMQTVGKDMAYTLRSETRFSNFRRNKASAGVSATLLGDALSAGVKVEDKLIANKRFRLVMTGGAMTGRGDVAYGGSLEAQLRDKDYPIGRSLSTLGLSVMDWHGDLAIGCNIQSQIPVGRNTNLVARANLNNRGAGQVSVRLNSSEQLQIALMGLIPLLRKLHGYAQQLQYDQ